MEHSRMLGGTRALFGKYRHALSSTTAHLVTRKTPFVETMSGEFALRVPCMDLAACSVALGNCFQ